MMSVGEAAKACGVSVRTLHHYDAIGLVRPSVVSDAGYRLYDAQAIARLQTVLFYKELGFPLKDIARMMDSPSFDMRQSLKDHRSLLLLQRERLNQLIALVDATMGGEEMKKIQTTQADIEQAKARYAQEAKERWGHTPEWRAQQSRQPSPQEELSAAQHADAIFADFAALVGAAPDDPAVQALVARWQAHISQHHYPCCKEILGSLGEMYVADERFTANLDRFGPGTAQLMSDAIRTFCQA